MLSLSGRQIIQQRNYYYKEVLVETEVQVTVKDWVVCPECGADHKVEITQNVMVEVEPEEMK